MKNIYEFSQKEIAKIISDHVATKANMDNVPVKVSISMKKKGDEITLKVTAEILEP